MISSPLEKKEQVNSLLDTAYASRVNDLNRSVELAEEALAMSRELDDKALIGKSLNQLSLYFMIRGQYEHSTRMSEEAITYFEELNDERGIADAKYNIAGIYYKTDNYHLGLVLMVDSLPIYQKYNDYHNISRVEKSLGTIYEYFGDQNSAVKSYENAIKAAIMKGDLNLESNAYNNLSGVYLKQGKIDAALEMIERSISMKRITGDVRGMAFAVYGRGKVYTNLRRFEEAEADFMESMRIHDEMGERLGLGMAYHKLAKLYMEMGLYDKAMLIANEGLSFSNKFNIVIIKFKCEFLLYKIFQLKNDPGNALEYLERYLRQKEAVINTQTLKVIENYEIITRMKTLEKEAQLQKEKAEIIEKKNRAEEVARVRQEFLSTMSHELRTPLNAVTTTVSLLKDRSNEEDQKLLDTLRFSSNNLLRIINDILDFTRLDSGKSDMELRPVKFKPLMENIQNTFTGMATEKGLKLSLIMGAGIGDTYELDETKLTQVLSNLISNAIKFTERGRVEIEVEKIADEKDLDRILFSVSDTGEGIPESDFNEIFQSFSHAKPVLTRKQGGTGLGLAIVKKLVELHGSKIEVRSKVGVGSVFQFELNLHKVIARESITTPNPEIPNILQGKTVLLAEDTEINAFLIRKLLSKWGVVTDHVVNGILAVEMSQKRAYDFILMDIHMPEMNGFEATKTIRSMENPNMRTPIFALTADITARNQTEYFSYFNGFLWKPLQIEKLFDALSGIAKAA